MIHYQTYTAVECDKLIDLWNRAFGGDFPMDRSLWQQNVDHCRRTFADASIVAVKDGHIIGAIVGKNPNRICTLFVAPEFRRQGVATELLERAEVAFTGELETTLVVGQDDRHFFPGVPENAVSAQEFFMAHGFNRHPGYTCDLIRSLDDWTKPEIRPETAAAMTELNIRLQPCSAELIPSLLEHVEENFSDRWLRDTRDRLAAEQDPGEFVVAVEDDVEVVAFCHTYSNRSQIIGPSINWRSLIGTEYGGLGPIGVSKHRRKIGLGLELLNYSVSHVAETGASQMVIDWTNLIDFYAKAGFSVWKRYISFSKTY